jgi:CRP-like cAMP-binding protein
MAENNQLLLSLPDADRAGLNEHFKIIELRQGQVLAEPGDDMRRIYFPHSGIVSFMVELINGSVVQTVMVGRDGVVGAAQALDGKKSINKIIVQVPGTASMIDRGPLLLLENGSAVRKMFASHAQFFVADIQQTAACNACHSVEARMARWLLRMRDLVGDDLPITHEYLGSMIGVERSTVSQIANEMRENGVISYVRGRVHIANVEILMNQSCECHQAVCENYETLLGAPWPALQ